MMPMTAPPAPDPAQVFNQAAPEVAPPPPEVGRDKMLAGPTSATETVRSLQATPGLDPGFLARRRPGTTLRQAQMLAAPDVTETVRPLVADPDDLASTASAAVLAERISPDPAQVKVALARATQAADAGVLSGELAELMAEARVNPTALLADDRGDRLAKTLAEFATQTDGIPTDDLALDATGRITKVQSTENGLVLVAEHPLGWNDGRVRDPMVRSARVGALNLSTMTDQGYQNLRRMWLYGQDAPVADSQPLLDVFLGVDLEAEIDEFPLEVEQALEALAEDVDAPFEEVVAQVAAGWAKAKQAAPHSGWADDDPFALLDNGSNPALEALSGRGGLPKAVLTSDVGVTPEALEVTANPDGWTTIALPNGQVAVAAPVNDETATAARHLTPGPAGNDGVPRWVPTSPQPFVDYGQFVGALPEMSPHTTHLAFDLDAVGGHPGLRPGDKVTAVVEKKFDAPVGFGVDVMRHLGVAGVTAPARRLDRKGPGDIAPENIDEAIGGSAWAVVADTPANRARLTRAGHRPIQQADSLLVVGITEEAATAVDETAMVPSNADVGVVFEAILDGGRVRWSPGQPEPVEGTGMESRAARLVEIAVSDSSKLAALADEIELRGGSDVTIYSSAQQVDGWQRAYETVASDGVQVVASRTRTGDPASPNGGHIFVKDASGLPESPTDPTVPPAPSSFTADGREIPRIRRDRSKPEWEERFGFEFDPAWREGNQVVEFSDQQQAEMAAVTEKFMAAHAAAVHRWGLPRVAASFTPDGDDSALEWKEGGAIVIARNAPDPATALATEFGHLMHGVVTFATQDEPAYDYERTGRAFANQLTGRASAADREVVAAVSAQVAKVVEHPTALNW